MKGKPEKTQSGPGKDSKKHRRAVRKRERIARKISRGSNRGQKRAAGGRKSWANV